MPHEISLYGDTLGYVLHAQQPLPPEPSTLKEALTGPYADKWKEAMDAEMAALVERGTWELVDLPPDKSTVGVKWVFKIKTNADGSLSRFKARLVAKGFSQIYGNDFYETFAPVSDFTTARSFLAVAAARNLSLVQLDVKNAFLYGTMDATVFMKQPEGYHDGTDKVCKLVKSHYGLKQSPKLWYDKLAQSLHALGFTKSPNDDALFTLPHAIPQYCLLYVDDILLSSPSKPALDLTIAALQREYTLTVTTSFSQYLGMNFSRSADGSITLSCEKYLSKIASRYSPSKPAYTPLPTPIS